mmetsp:Transcript_17197/g.41412  ORF Transcript_17197/g.41412 Transcript_17197/m.41412 type:complete len:363 (+) Transcript_17197:140-1228(+)
MPGPSAGGVGATPRCRSTGSHGYNSSLAGDPHLFLPGRHQTARRLLHGLPLLGDFCHQSPLLALLRLQGALELLLRNHSAPLLDGVLLQLAVALHLVEVHLSEELLLVLLAHEGRLALLLFRQLVESLNLTLNHVAILRNIAFEISSELILVFNLRGAIMIDLLQKLASCNLILHPYLVLLLPLPLGLFGLQSLQLLLALSLASHLHLQRLLELLGLLALRLSLGGFLLCHGLFASEHRHHELSVLVLLNINRLGLLAGLDCSVFVNLLALLHCGQLFSLDLLSGLLLLNPPCLTHGFSFHLLRSTIVRLLRRLVLQLRFQGAGCLRLPVGLQSLLLELTVNFRLVTLLPECVVNRLFTRVL